MKKLVLIISFIIVNMLHATTLDEAKELTLERAIKNNWIVADEEQEQSIKVYDIAKNNKLIIAKLNGVREDNYAINAEFFCFGVLAKDKLIDGFCDNGYGSNVILTQKSDEEFFTIKVMKEIEEYQINYKQYTFAISANDIYLYKYQHIEEFNECDKTIIDTYYSIDFSNLIYLESINDDLLYKLESKYDENGKCRE